MIKVEREDESLMDRHHHREETVLEEAFAALRRITGIEARTGLDPL